jgi:hypothetical protein
MTEASYAPIETIKSDRQIAQEQYLGIKHLYQDIFSMTSMEERREIARHYEWINPQKPLNAVCRKKVTPTSNIAHANSIAYNLCDEYRLSEAGLVRDTLIQDQQFARFNRTVRMINKGELSPDHINMADLTNVIDTLLKYDVLATQEFKQELLDRNKPPIRLRNGAGELIEDAGDTFFRMIDELQTSMGILNRNKNTQALMNQAIDILSFRVNSKVAQLGVEQGVDKLSQIATSNQGLNALRGIVDKMIAGMSGVISMRDPQSEIPTQPVAVPKRNLIDGHTTSIYYEYPLVGCRRFQEIAWRIEDLKYKGREGFLKIMMMPSGSWVIKFFPNEFLLKEGKGHFESLPFDPDMAIQIVKEQFGIDLKKVEVR